MTGWWRGSSARRKPWRRGGDREAVVRSEARSGVVVRGGGFNEPELRRRECPAQYAAGISALHDQFRDGSSKMGLQKKFKASGYPSPIKNSRPLGPSSLH